MTTTHTLARGMGLVGLLALVVGGLATTPASAAANSDGTVTIHADSAQAAAGERASGNCAGRIVDSWPLRVGATKIGELVLYWNSANRTNCARMNHLGPTYNVALRTTVFLAACRERTGSVCTYASPPRTDDGTYRLYAGPVTVAAGGRCVHAAGDIYYQGVRRHVDSSPWLSHCG